MSRQRGMTLLEVLITIVVVAVGASVLARLSVESFQRNRKVKRLIDAGHAIESAIERERIFIAGDPGQAATPDNPAVPGNFPDPGVVWNDTDHVNNIIVACSTYAALAPDGTVLESVRMLKARADIYPLTGGFSDGATDTLTVTTAVSRFF